VRKGKGDKAKKKISGGHSLERVRRGGSQRNKEGPHLVIYFGKGKKKRRADNLQKKKQ